MASQEKQTQLEKVTSFLQESDSFTLLKFEKTTHTALEGLRKQLKKSNAKILVVKNTILQKAINKLSAGKDKAYLRDLQKQTRNLRENTAVIGFKGEWSEAMHAFFDFSKGDKSVTFKVGVLDKTAYNGADLNRIAQLPGKDQLVAKLLGSMKSPVAHMTNALKFNMQKFVYILTERSKKS